jgi:exodeoxyribonuclease VII large subunit
VRIVLAPVRVQGDGAAGEIARAVQRFNRYAQVDVLIVGRGGGALEDLWAFNDEGVVRAIAASRIPVISAIGHEVDTTLADLAADVRAATPSNAAELAVPDRRAVRRLADGLRERADRTLAESLATLRRRLEDVLARYGFRRQRDVVDRWRQRLDDLMGRTLDAVRGALDRLRERTRSAAERYGLREFPRAVAGRRTEIEEASRRLGRALAEAVRGRRTRVASADDRLRALSPRLVLERGYCLVRGPDGRLLRAAAELSVGERIALEFARGQADARVEAVRSGDSNGR